MKLCSLIRYLTPTLSANHIPRQFYGFIRAYASEEIIGDSVGDNNLCHLVSQSDSVKFFPCFGFRKKRLERDLDVARKVATVESLWHIALQVLLSQSCC